jgi:uncharacterized membrane protein
MFVTAFVIVGINGLNHHRLFALIERVDTPLKLLNLFLLLGICIVPFTTAMIAKCMITPDDLVSAIYGVVWTINGFLYTSILVYARAAWPADECRVREE